MVKRNSNARKPSGAAAIKVVGDDHDNATDGIGHEDNGSRSDVGSSATKPKRIGKAKPGHESAGHFAVSDIKKAAAFANSIGGLDKAIAVLQILKVAKEVQ
jgi:hypothetical protein